MNRARHTGGVAINPPWHDWRFELVPRGTNANSTAPPRGQASTGDGHAHHAGDALLEARDHTPRFDSMRTSGGEPMTTTIRSRKVRRILRIERQADRQGAREARAAARATLLQRRVDTLRSEARALEASLNGAQRTELGRARACPAPMVPLSPTPRVRRRVSDNPRCPVMPGETPAAGAEPAPEPHEEA